MRLIVPYLFFDGNCREAMTLYAEALDTPLELSTYGDAPNCPPAEKDRVMHSRIAKGSAQLMASDTSTMSGETKFVVGDNMSVSVDCESAEEQDRIFAKLSEGGTVKMQLQDTFWGARFGMLRDRFGVDWMFNYDNPKT